MPDYYTETPLDYTYDDVLAWLKEQPSDKIVHHGSENICETCTIAQFLQDKLNDPSISVAFVTAESTEKDVVYRLHKWFAYVIHILDGIADGDDVISAGQAVGILENMTVRT